ncbi:MAG: adenosylcobinamide-GDP ribazoletransferase [Allorhizobium sp.]
MDFGGYLYDTIRSIAFLSRIPVAGRYFSGEDVRISRWVRGFPLAGVAILLPVSLFYALLLTLGATPLMAAFASLAMQALLTGMLHEDGLSDTADGLGGGRDREQTLVIMKDSRIGTYGATALILSFGLRASALAALAEHLSIVAAAACLPAVAALSRALMVWHWSALPSARADGVAVAAGQPERSARNQALLTGLVLTALLVLPGAGLPALLCALAAAALGVAAVTAMVRAKIGGHTGDTIGAAQQICEAVALCALAIAA